MSSLFDGETSFNHDISHWDVSNVASMQRMFYNAQAFDQDIGNWDVSNVTSMTRAFRGASNFDQDLDSWDVSNVVTMDYMFSNASSFNGAMGSWDVHSVTKMDGMFYKAGQFNQDISGWDVSNVTTMFYMFNEAHLFDQSIGVWDVSSVSSMYAMFRNAYRFNSPIDAWDVGAVTQMSYMFQGAINFDQPIGSWDVINVQSFNFMFDNALKFNQDIGAWDVSNATNLYSMFSYAGDFDQDLTGWCVPGHNGVSFASYSALLPAHYPVWGTCPCGDQLDSIAPINADKGIYRAYYSGLAVDDSFHLEWKSRADSTWRSKMLSRAALLSGSQKFNASPWFNDSVDVRISRTGSQQFRGCSSLQTNCKPMTLQLVEQRPAFCAADSVLLRAGHSGGQGGKTYLWSNGATTKRTYADQGETLTVTVTDATGCSISDSITASTLAPTPVPINLLVTTSGANISASWTAPALSSGQNLIGYRLAYRLRNTQAWTKAPLTTSTSYSMDWTGSGNPAGNYEFAVLTRYHENGVVRSSNLSCKLVKGYNGVGNKSEDSNQGSAEASKVSVYPNPAQDMLYVQAPLSSELVLMDMQGKTIIRRTSTAVETSLDLSSFTQGVYMLHVQTSWGSFSQRVVHN
jgi:surface protein